MQMAYVRRCGDDLRAESADGPVHIMGRMPQWTKGSGARLVQAALTLAALQPIHDVTVAALCQEAGVTRDTFYRYAASPIDVLAQGMSQDIPPVGELVALTDRDAGTSPLEAPGLAVIEHVERNRAIYRNALRPHLDSALREVLFGRINGLLLGYLDAHRDVLPDIDGARPTPTEVRRIAVFTTSGIIGAVEDWVAQRRPDPARHMLALLFVAAAPWWRRQGV